jgi:hypothetical protein
MKLYKQADGKTFLLEEGDRKRLQRRLKELRSSSRGKGQGRTGGKKAKFWLAEDDDLEPPDPRDPGAARLPRRDPRDPTAW